MIRQPGRRHRTAATANELVNVSFNRSVPHRCPVWTASVIGDVGDGWRVAQTTLANERRFGSIFAAPRVAQWAFEEARAEIEEHFQPYVWYPQRGGRVDLLV